MQNNPKTLPPKCICGTQTVSRCAGCGKHLCRDCAEKCGEEGGNGCGRLYCGIGLCIEQYEDCCIEKRNKNEPSENDDSENEGIDYPDSDALDDDYW